MKILQICFRVPYPPHDGGAIAMYNITKGLHKNGHEVTVLAFNTPKHFQEDTVLKGIATLKTIFVNTSISPWKALVNIFKPLPYNLERFISQEFESALVNLLSKEKFDAVHFEGTYVAWYVDAVRKVSSAPLVLRTHNLEYLIWERLAKNSTSIFKRWYLKNLSQKLRRFEERYFTKFDAIASISPEDARLIQQWLGNKTVEVIPFGIDKEILNRTTTIVPEPNTLFIISALEWMPNLEALEWFLGKVWPDLHRINPQLQLHIAGKKTPRKIMELKLPNVTIHGFVPDAFEFMRKYELMLVPLLSGSGTRIKILEGMAVKKCIVTSCLGAEGMDYKDKENILIANTPEEWVSRILEYFSSPQKYKSIGANAFSLIKEKYDNDAIIHRLTDLYKKLQ